MQASRREGDGMNIADMGFTEIDKSILPDGIVEGYAYGKANCKLMEAENDLSGRLTKVISENYTSEEFRAFAEEADCDYLLLYWRRQEEIRLMSFSRCSDVRALEFLDYIITDFGLAKGNAESAFGRISTAVLDAEAFREEISGYTEFLLRMSANYFEKCDWVYADAYSAENKEYIDSLKSYRKRRVPWAYIRTTEIVPAGGRIKIKSLENESGLVITAKEDTFIMIGCRGEVYDMNFEKFSNTYETTDEHLDIFERMLDFLPEVEALDENRFITLDELAKICYPIQKAVIKAVQIDNRTKVFKNADSTEYFLGRPGDFMAVRMDDYSDIYIIQNEVFTRTYEESSL